MRVRTGRAFELPPVRIGLVKRLLNANRSSWLINSDLEMQIFGQALEAKPNPRDGSEVARTGLGSGEQWNSEPT